MKNSLLRLTKICTLIMICCGYACTEPQKIEPSEQNRDLNSNIIPLEETINELNDCLDYIDVQTRGVKKREIADIHLLNNNQTRNTQNDNPTIYLVNFEDAQGFALISGDKRLPAILAIADQGNLNPEQGTDNPGLLLFLANAETYCNTTLSIDEEHQPNTLISNGYATASAQTSLTTIQYTDWFTWGASGEILPSKWHQKAPFNKYCFTTNGKKALAGCQAIAIGQLMYYHGKNYTYEGRYYDWDIMHTVTTTSSGTSTAKDMVGRFISDIGKTNGTVYGINNSSAQTSSIPNSFSAFGYSQPGTIQNYDFQEIQFELYDSPVIVRGDAIKTVTPKKILGITVGSTTTYSGGHAWVIDRYICQYRHKIIKDNTTGNEISKTREDRRLVHCNWGWGGDSDGYYFSEAFDTNSGRIETQSPMNATRTTEGTDYYYQFNIKMVTNIRP